MLRMPRSGQNVPPRPLEIGDVVAGFSDLLGEWTAAQITGINPDWKCVGVLEFDWSGPEPPSVDDLAGVSPLVLTHHSWSGKLAHTNYEWLLPRGYEVVGNMPLVLDEPARAYSFGWKLGDQLSKQRRWSSGDRGSDPRTLELDGPGLASALESDAAMNLDVLHLAVEGIESADCDRLADVFPNLTRLTLAGKLGQLTNAAALNRLYALRALFIDDLFGMSGADRVLPTQLPGLEALVIRSVPEDYAKATRARWRVEIPNGTYLEVTGARKPEWIEENRTNPLRDWDGRAHITPARYKKAVSQFRATKRELISVLEQTSADSTHARLAELGDQFARAFNKISGRSEFIETEEREELLLAVDAVFDEAQTGFAGDLRGERQAFFEAADKVREW